jgi:hypothetical protein
VYVHAGALAILSVQILPRYGLLRIASTFSKKRQGLLRALINLNGLHLENGTTAPPVQDQALFFEVTA